MCAAQNEPRDPSPKGFWGWPTKPHLGRRHLVVSHRAPTSSSASGGVDAEAAEPTSGASDLVGDSEPSPFLVLLLDGWIQCASFSLTHPSTSLFVVQRVRSLSRTESDPGSNPALSADLPLFFSFDSVWAPKPDWAPVTVPSQAHTHSLRGPCRSHQPVQEYRFRYHNRRELLTVVSINELPGTQLLENTVLSNKKLATRKAKTGQFLSL